jgi:hypothetical protein
MRRQSLAILDLVLKAEGGAIAARAIPIDEFRF